MALLRWVHGTVSKRKIAKGVAMLTQFEDLSDDLQLMISKLEMDVKESQSEANFYRAAVLFSFVLTVERIWDRLC